MNPLISVVVPVFNGERFLAEAIESVLAQTWRPIEVLVVDDGSSDGSAAAAERFGPPVQTLRQEHRGPPAARNLGLRAARGDLVAFLDADDLWLPEKLARQAARFGARPDLDISMVHVENFWMPEVADERRLLGDHPLTRPLPGYVFDAILIRRRVFGAVGLLDERLPHGDCAEFLLRARQAGTVEELLPDLLVRRRIHRGNASRAAGRKKREDALAIVRQTLDRRRGAAGRPSAP